MFSEGPCVEYIDSTVELIRDDVFFWGVGPCGQKIGQHGCSLKELFNNLAFCLFLFVSKLPGGEQAVLLCTPVVYCCHRLKETVARDWTETLRPNETSLRISLLSKILYGPSLESEHSGQ